MRTDSFVRVLTHYSYEYLLYLYYWPVVTRTEKIGDVHYSGTLETQNNKTSGFESEFNS